MTTSNFEERLLAGLREVVAARPAPIAPPRRRGRGRLVLSGAALSAAAAAVAIIATGGNVASPAYAVDSNPDGTVSVRINGLSDAGGLQEKLRAAGVPAVVRYVPGSDLPNCPAGPTETRKAPEAGAAPGPSLTTGGTPRKEPDAPKATSSVSMDQDGHATFTLSPGNLGPDDHVLVTTSDGTLSTVAIQVTRANTASGPGQGEGVPACHSGE